MISIFTQTIDHTMNPLFQTRFPDCISLINIGYQKKNIARFDDLSLYRYNEHCTTAISLPKFRIRILMLFKVAYILLKLHIFSGLLYQKFFDNQINYINAPI